MAKRRQSNDGGMNLDSLLDTMTNVVGILIIVLIVTQLNVAAAVKRIFSEFPPVSEEQLAELRVKVEKEKEELAELQKTDPEKLKEEKKELEEAVAEAIEKRKTAKEELEGLKKTDTANKAELLKLEVAMKEAEAKGDEVKGKEGEVNLLLAEIAKLKAELDDTPIFTEPPPKVVRMPDPRSVPKGAVAKTFYCIGDRVIYLPMVEFQEAMKEKLEAAASDRLNPQWAKLVASKKTAKVNGRNVETNVYDPRQVMAYLKANPLENETMKVDFTVPETSNRGRLTLVFKENAGETAEQIAYAGSGFQRAVRTLKSQNVYLWFIVMPDAFDSYLLARAYVDSNKVPAGWEPGYPPAAGKPLTSTAVCYNMEFKQMKKPPPPDPTKPPPPPAPKRPGRNLD